MLSSELSQEIGALIRGLSQRIRLDPELQIDDIDDVQRRLDEAIVALCAIRIKLTYVSTHLPE